MVVVVGFIPTAQGWAAVHAGAREAKALGARLVVVNATNGDAPSDRRRAQDEDLARLREVLDASPAEYGVERLTGGRDAADAILDVATRYDASRLVIGVRRRTAVGKFVLGSTAQRVLLGADCPVLAVKSSVR